MSTAIDQGTHGTTASWHELHREQVLAKLATDGHGLSEAEARQRLRQHGPNVLPHEPAPGIGQIVLRQFMSPLIYILLLAAVVALAVRDYQSGHRVAGPPT